jgi:hypothetical protein
VGKAGARKGVSVETSIWVADGLPPLAPHALRLWAEKYGDRCFGPHAEVYAARAANNLQSYGTVRRAVAAGALRPGDVDAWAMREAAARANGTPAPTTTPAARPERTEKRDQRRLDDEQGPDPYDVLARAAVDDDEDGDDEADDGEAPPSRVVRRAAPVWAQIPAFLRR